MLQAIPQYAKFTALVVDDDEITIALVSGVLKRIGFAEIIKAHDGSAGLALAKTHLPDIIICDLAMAPMDGLTFLKLLRGSSLEKLAQAPVLLFTGSSDVETIKSAAACNVKAFIVKPSAPKAFAEKVHAAMAPRLAHEERLEELKRRMVT